MGSVCIGDVGTNVESVE